MAKASYSYKIDSHVQGIPCSIAIGYYNKVEGDFRTWDSDSDYYGYEEMDWSILDRKGYLASWLEKKLTDDDRDRIENEISEYFENLKNNYDY